MIRGAIVEQLSGTARFKLVGVGIMMVAFALPLLAQDAGTVHGAVVDSSGAIIPGAAVTALQVKTGTRRVTKTNNAGQYSLPQLAPGEYELTAEKDGFRKLVRGGLNLTTGQDASLDFSLSVGGASETVNVAAGAELIDTAGSSLSTVIQGRQVVDMPLNGRNVLNLVTLVPGVIPQGSSSGNPLGNQNGGALSQPGGIGNYQIGGGFAGQSVIYIDGAPNNMLLQNNYVSIDPIQDSIQEFRVETNNPSAKFGGFNGGVVNMTTKSGQNAFHGTAYEYIRNKVLNANNFFNNRNHIGRPSFTQNQYGADLGGPIVKNHTFFFGSWENFSLRQGNPLVLTVPTAKMRTGDFSEIGAQIYDPCGGTVTQGGQGCPTYTGARTAFSQNMIPANRLDPTAQVMLTYFPLPNLAGTVNNYAVNAATGGDSREYNARVDHTLTDKQRLFGRYTQWHLLNPAQDPFRNGTGLPTQDNLSRQAVLGYTNAITPTTVLDARLSWLFLRYQLSDNNTIDESQFGPAYAALSSQLQFHVLPLPSSITGGYTSAAILGARNFQLHNFEDSTAFISLTKILGKHTVEVGGEYRNGKRFPGFNVFNGSTRTNFTNSFTAASNGGAGGYSLASFVLGYASFGDVSKVQPVDQLLVAQGYYIADTFQMKKKLTLNLGLRWDQPGAIHERNDLNTVFLSGQSDPLGSFVNPVTGQTQQTTGQLVLVNTAAYPSRNDRNLRHDLFSPRMGFAYELNDAAVLRGGFGISFIRTIGTDVGPRLSPINSATTTMANTLDGGKTPNATLANPYPGVTLLSPAGRDVNALRNLQEGQSINGMVPTNPYGYIEQWNLSLQQQVGRNGVFQVGYAATAGLHLPRNGGYNLDQLPDQYDSLGTALTTQVANPFAGKIASGTLSGATIPMGQLLRPYPQFSGVASQTAYGGQSIYHSLETSFRQRLGAGGTFLGSYTWSKLIDNVDSLSSGYLDSLIGTSQDYTRLDLDRSRSSFDAPHRLVVSYVVELPFGRGKRFLGHSGSFVDHVVSGFSANGVTTFQQGYPLPVIAQSSVLNSNFGAGQTRPNVVGGCQRVIPGASQQKLTKFFNTACFTQPGPYAFGNESRTDSVIRNAGIANYDFGLIKVTPITESVRIQFNTEVFNLFNRVQFGVPGNQLGNGNFGVVSSQANQPRLIQFALRVLF